MNKVVYGETFFKPVVKVKTIEVPTGEKKRGFSGGEKDWSGRARFRHVLPRLTAALALTGLTGCVTWYPARVTPVDIPCTNAAHCDRLWQATQLAIVERSRFRIQVANDVVIETFGPRSIDFAYRATRQRNPDGSGSVRVMALCDATVYGCVNDPQLATSHIGATLKNVR